MTTPALAPGGLESQEFHFPAKPQSSPQHPAVILLERPPPAPNPQPGEPTQLQTNQHSFPIFLMATLC